MEDEPALVQAADDEHALRRLAGELLIRGGFTGPATARKHQRVPGGEDLTELLDPGLASGFVPKPFLRRSLVGSVRGAVRARSSATK